MLTAFVRSFLISLLMLVGCATQPSRLPQATPASLLFNSAASKGNYAETYPKLLLLAQGGDSEAQFMTGYYLIKGQGTEKNEQEAFNWFAKSAATGHHGGMNWLASCYVAGWGTPKNPQLAISWYEKSAALGNGGSIYEIGNAYFYGYVYPKDYNKALANYINALAKGNKKALESLERLAQTEPSAQRELGGMYYYGKGVKKNYTTAYRYFDQCAIRNDATCFFFLGKILQTGGDGVEQDRSKAKFAFEEGATRGNQQARTALDSINSAQSFVEGLGTALLIGLVIFGAAAAGNSGAYSNSGSSPDLSAILDRPRAAEVRPYSSSGSSVSTGTVPSTRKVEQDVEAVNIYTREKYKGSADSFGNVTLHPQYDPGTKYKGTVDSDGTGRVRSSSGDELKIDRR